MNKRQFLKEEKDCSSLHGITLEEYRKSLKNVKAGSSNKGPKKYDNSILHRFGLTEKDLKKLAYK